MNTIQQLIKSIELSFENDNHYAALTVALTLPDICGKLESPMKKSSVRFIEWFDRYLKENFQSNQQGELNIFLTANDCYALRCSFLHEANDDISEQRAKETLDKISFVTMNLHKIKIDNVLFLNVKMFCIAIIEAVKNWLKDIDTDKDIQERINNLLKINTSGFSPMPGIYLGNQ
ncbi:hypothetical protein AB670_00006 [Chryseobacterium sp. MOF25P]|uniref:hypothetical protein n=1 Tax=unclassified Chryseobacterium TaxID=2593645 RepID=UPI000804A943|nr:MULTISPECIES: hypothetical protein [unclassified Chryseobacterium]OBW43477.1 hypothetical protein AB670_00006 [Chryseobacterium sp. MOF25P]OBW46749.1 hypothetical protein AB671_01245 [Chryseobacterium sp. BGARF1]